MKIDPSFIRNIEDETTELTTSQSAISFAFEYFGSRCYYFTTTKPEPTLIIWQEGSRNRPMILLKVAQYLPMPDIRREEHIANLLDLTFLQ